MGRRRAAERETRGTRRRPSRSPTREARSCSPLGGPHLVRSRNPARCPRPRCSGRLRRGWRNRSAPHSLMTLIATTEGASGVPWCWAFGATVDRRHACCLTDLRMTCRRGAVIRECKVGSGASGQVHPLVMPPSLQSHSSSSSGSHCRRPWRTVRTTTCFGSMRYTTR